MAHLDLYNDCFSLRDNSLQDEVLAKQTQTSTGYVILIPIDSCSVIIMIHSL